MSLIRSSPIRRLAPGLVVVAALLTGPLGTATATASPRTKPPELTLDGTGTWQIRPWIDDMIVSGSGHFASRSGKTTDVLVAAVVEADDGTFPAAGECEDAFATMSAYGARGIDFTMVGPGQLCGHLPQLPTSVVTQVFTGRYEVSGERTTPKRLLGSDGFFEIRVAEDGAASVFAIDT